ncbi:hypothetical protein scyTo_0024711 [Scyliorhinus torazame]|uniref:Uncharacterized protein n=1 Tax=Scyliorhinus torazame TaxID=75743 RepID=A0A401QEV9_SCYTO|nr:hypothetical protein [Scyliorhinus torazame]
MSQIWLELFSLRLSAGLDPLFAPHTRADQKVNQLLDVCVFRPDSCVDYPGTPPQPQPGLAPLQRAQLAASPRGGGRLAGALRLSRSEHTVPRLVSELTGFKEPRD